jgi:polysaccharide biosynthesis/export protein
VSETGMLSLPMLQDPIKAAGLSEQQLQKAIAAKYKDAGVLEDARVSVTVLEARQRTYWISGAVGQAGQYPIPEADFRLYNAVVQARDTYPTIEYIYVIRQREADVPATAPAPEEPKQTPPGQDILAPRSQVTSPVRPILAMMQDSSATAPAQAPAAEGTSAGSQERQITIGGESRTIAATEEKPAATQAAPATEPAPSVAAPQPAYEFGSTVKKPDRQRVIKVPWALLRNGDLRYNIVVRPNDVIVVPQIQSEGYYMGGHFGAPGPYSLTGQKITLKQAVIGARMMDPLAVPEKTDVIRRVGNNEIWVRVDLKKVFSGLQPDLYLKANDIVTVGTDWYPPFLQALRTAFRMTYGFGFLYDRNWADTTQNGNSF